MIEKLEKIQTDALLQIEASRSLEELEVTRLSYLGKKGSLIEILKSLSALSPEEKRSGGAFANRVKQSIEFALQARKSQLEQTVFEKRLEGERIDLTGPSRRLHQGSLHVVTQVTERILEILGRIGFDVTLGPEVETDYLNFEAVNIPPDHPARDMQDTFFLGPGVLLRTHTSAAQIRSMLAEKAPLRILCPGAVYRCDYDATHTPMFHQIEGLWVDEKVTLAHLKGVLEYLAQELFGKSTQIRLRPSYFPFVEPGAEVDVSCFQCRKKPVTSCKVCKGTGWLEILGAGMVHPTLFDKVGYASHLTGFAFGMGVERIAMLLYGIPDIRMLYQSDSRLLSQF